MNKVAEQLRKARQAKGIELKEAEEATKIRTKYLIVLEKGDYSILPGLAYTVGFLRSYARFLDLDADNLVSTFHKQITEIKSETGSDEAISLIAKILHCIRKR